MICSIFLNSGIKITEYKKTDTVICADGGYNVCPVKPDYVIGDFDSAIEIEDGVKRVTFDPHKNFTDGEAAVRLAADLKADTVVFYGVLGGRYDHTLGNFNILALADSLGMNAVCRENGLDIYFKSASENAFELCTTEGETLSVLPHGGNALVAHSDGLEYPLENLLLKSVDSRGISNVVTKNTVTLSIASGSVLIFHYRNISAE